jgi:hypothetical protein
MPAQSDYNDFSKRTLQTEDIQPVENQGATSYTLIGRHRCTIITTITTPPPQQRRKF